MKNAIGEQTKMRFIAFVAVVEVRGASFVQAEKCFSDGWTDQLINGRTNSHMKMLVRIKYLRKYRSDT